MASTGVTAMAISAIWFRFTWNMRDGSDFPVLEAAATLLLTFGGVVSSAVLHESERHATHLICACKPPGAHCMAILFKACPLSRRWKSFPPQKFSALAQSLLWWPGGHGDVCQMGSQGPVA